MLLYKIFFDGACHNKKGENNPMGLGIAVFLNGEYLEKESNAIHAEGLNGDRGTSNLAEWKACVEAMRKACRIIKTTPGAKFQIFSDSEVITKQFNGDYIIKEFSFKKYHDEAHKFAKIAGIRVVMQIPREKNKEADKLSKQGLKEEL